MINPLSFAEQYFNVSFVRTRNNEYRSINGCPYCGDGGKGKNSDRFHLFTDGSPRVWCRKCEYSAYLNALESRKVHNDIEARIIALERYQEQQRSTQQALEKRVKALERIHNCTDHIYYHRNLTPQHYEYWSQQGINPRSVSLYRLGYCEHCPADWRLNDRGEYEFLGRASYTIPVINNGVLYNIRHRLTGEISDKYRPHISGLPGVLFNADNLMANSNTIIIVEGEKKSIVAGQYGLLTVAIMGKNGFNSEWIEVFSKFQKIIVCLDPDATLRAISIAKLFDNRGYVVSLPAKLDDMLLASNSAIGDIRDALSRSEQIA